MVYKVCIGVMEIAGYNDNLQKGFQQLGIDCSFINFFPHPFQYGENDTSGLLIRLYKMNYIFLNKCRNTMLKIPFFLFNQILKLSIFIWALSCHNVFIFGFGTSFFFRHIDLPILKLFNKKIIFVFFGSDGRPPYIDGSLKDASLEHYRLKTREIKRNILLIERYSDHTISHPASSHFHAVQFINWLSIGIPFDGKDCEEHEQKAAGNANIVILHSPSDPIAKGSDRIRTAISAVKQKGYPVDYIEITGKPHKDVIEILRRCDFVVDQAYSDTPLAVFATEAAWFGKPAVVGGYYSEFKNTLCTSPDSPPGIYCHPDEMAAAIEHLIVDEGFRRKMGKYAQDYVRLKWTPENVAKRYLQVIEEAIPDTWVCDPHDIRYLQGSGLPESRSRDIIRGMIERYGRESLCLPDKPELEQRFIEYACDTRK